MPRRPPRAPFPALLLILAAGFPARAATDTLVLAAGESRTLAATAAPLVLDGLDLGDGATLRLAAGTDWRIEARRARIGEGVRVLAAGRDGEAGTDGAAGADGRACDDGTAGGRGTAGGAGADGARLVLDLGLVAFGSLRVEAPGGAGGRGGRGGRGGDAGPSDDCHGGDGGAGGPGGNGGRGGRGGDVEIVYRPLTEAGALVVGNDGSGLDVRVDGGAGGPGGPGGPGGTGGEGGRGERATGRPVFWNEGETGADGGPGGDGTAGPEGRFRIRVLPPRTDA
jgi:hypothetical protein